MYAHPSFVRGNPQSLLQLRKTTPSQRRRLVSDASHGQQNKQQPPSHPNPRSVSPHLTTANDPHGNNLVLIQAPTPTNVHRRPSLVSPVPPRPVVLSSTIPKADRGKLDLLTFALEHEFAKRL